MSITNGNTEQENRPPLPPENEAVVEQAMRMQQQIQADRARLTRELAEARSQNAEAVIQIESLQAMVRLYQGQAESVQAAFDSHVRSVEVACEDRIRKHRDERDVAMDEMSKYKTILMSFRAQMAAFEVPSAPLIKVQEDGR